ncbi:MucB/RseB-like sigma(E) regulatory protein [Hydrogenispora ethanolica]|uniref:MucB/RseB-like sigma(E) regulatory protein n=1 Tax=Hydrogenispora ethanolica TaxID=1082276 RepID=A0A4R1SBL7_HYDET|nr:outer membrane lipoprotein-sorting protein [Hydrogenispora ethanolica]TCL76400.1 MucB/RseB-like sigma(E) regulatory protein [Hydrogenispora ethanolica]
MNKNIGAWLFMLFTVLAAAAIPGLEAAGLSPDEILARIDQNHFYQSAYTESRMEITIGSRKVTKAMRGWNEGREKSFVEFTDKRDQSRILKLKDDLWIFSPTAESEVKLSGDMLRQGMAGSDFSYQDALEAQHLRDLYRAKLIGEATIGDRPCFLLDLIARDNVEVSYYQRKIWVDKERFIELKEEMYAPSGKLLKVSSIEKVEQFENRYYPTVVVMADKLRKNSSTRFVIEKIQFNVPIPAGTFTRQHLTGR